MQHCKTATFINQVETMAEENEMQAMENAIIGDGVLSIEMQLDMLEKDLGAAQDIIKNLPRGLGTQLLSQDFLSSALRGVCAPRRRW